MSLYSSVKLSVIYLDKGAVSVSLRMDGVIGRFHFKFNFIIDIIFSFRWELAKKIIFFFTPLLYSLYFSLYYIIFVFVCTLRFSRASVDHLMAAKLSQRLKHPYSLQ